LNTWKSESACAGNEEERLENMMTRRLRKIISENLLERISNIRRPVEFIVEENARLRQWLVREAIGESIRQLLKSLTNLPYMVSEYDDEVWGRVYEVTVHTDARQALELELRLTEAFPYVPLVVKWTGEMNISSDELADYLAKIMMKSHLRPRALRGFDAVKIVREERED